MNAIRGEMRLPAIQIATGALVAAFFGAPAAAAELIMVREDGCVWCARWEAEIGPAYPKTPEGQAAPLRRIDLHAPVPGDLHFAAPLRISPTFVLVDGGEEVARVEGYPGDEFFWHLLSEMLDKLPEE